MYLEPQASRIPRSLRELAEFQQVSNSSFVIIVLSYLSHLHFRCGISGTYIGGTDQSSLSLVNKAGIFATH